LKNTYDVFIVDYIVLTNKCYSARTRPDEKGYLWFAEPGIIPLTLENHMNIKLLFGGAIAIIAVNSAFAQQREFIAPDAGFKSVVTRAEMRQDLRTGDRSAWHQRDGQDTGYTAGTESRKDVRAETARTARARHTVNVQDLYFGS
jgi:hypothetical protein